MKHRAVESYRKFYGHFSVQIWARYNITCNQIDVISFQHLHMGLRALAMLTVISHKFPGWCPVVPSFHTIGLQHSWQNEVCPCAQHSQTHGWTLVNTEGHLPQTQRLPHECISVPEPEIKHFLLLVPLVECMKSGTLLTWSLIGHENLAVLIEWQY